MTKIHLSLKAKMGVAFVIIFILLGLAFNIWDYRRIRQLVINRDRFGHRSATSQLSGRVAAPSSVTIVPIDNDVQLNRDLETVLWWLITSTILSAILAGILFYACAMLLLRPLQKIIKAVKAFTTDQLTSGIKVNDVGDEVYELGVNINRMVSRIDEASKLQQNFFASASHELKTPLAILRIQLEVALASHDLDQKARDFFTNQLEEICRLQEIVWELLVISQLKAEALTLHKRQTDLANLIVRVFSHLLPILEKKELQPHLVFDKDCSSFLIDADEDMLRIVFMNIIENASKYASPGSLVQCLVHRLMDKEVLIIEVKNTTREQFIDTAKIREAFFRSVSIEQGAGLGLWLCDQILTLHGGSMSISSENYRFELQIMLPISGSAK